MSSPTRRGLLAGAGAVSTALAGCSALSNPELTAVSAGLDWPMAGGTAGNARVAPEAAAPPLGMEPRWGVRLPGPESPPVVADGRLVVSVNDRAHAFGLDGAGTWEQGVDGRPLWEHEYDGGVSARIAPAITDGTVYVVTESPPDGRARLVALDADNGTRRWSTNLGRTAPPLAFAEHVVVPGPGDAVEVRRASDGEAVDRRAVRGPVDSLFGDEVRLGRPVAAGRTLFVPYETHTDHRIAALGRAGGWDVRVRGRVTGLAVSQGSLVVTTDRGVEALAAGSGERRWRATPGRSHTPVVTGEVVLAHTDRELSAYDTVGGTLEWRLETNRFPLAAAGDRLYTYHRREEGEGSGLRARALGSGEELAGWSLDGRNVRGFAVADGHATVVTEQSLTVYA